MKLEIDPGERGVLVACIDHLVESYECAIVQRGTGADNRGLQATVNTAKALRAKLMPTCKHCSVPIHDQGGQWYARQTGQLFCNGRGEKHAPAFEPEFPCSTCGSPGPGHNLTHPCGR